MNDDREKETQEYWARWKKENGLGCLVWIIIACFYLFCGVRSCCGGHGHHRSRSSGSGYDYTEKYERWGRAVDIR